MTPSPYRFSAAGCVAVCLLLGACSTGIMPQTTPQVYSAYGESVRQARALQTIDPDAGRKATVVGIDGEAGHSAMERYQKGFKEPPRTFGILGIGGSTLAGTGSGD